MAKKTAAVTPAQFETFGALLKFLRRRAGLTQRDLSIAVGYSESQISRLEKNERAPDQAALAARFVPALQLEHDAVWTARLLELGGASRGRATDEHVDQVSPRNNLPIQLTSFIGRTNELAQIKQVLTESSPQVRLLTLTGHGGCGKTRLALQAANELLDCFADGVWFIELAPLSDASLVPQAIGNVLGIPKQAGEPMLTTLAETLRAQECLLILDNCEHVVQAAAQCIETLLNVCPNLCVIATSRELLGAAGEHALYVRSLAIPETHAGLNVDALMQYGAVQLFVERAVSVVPDFVLTNENAGAVVQICERLDGIPLALELAAARLRMLSVEQIAARLDNAFRLLTGGRRTALPRHQTLQALIDWSYDLLTPSERILFQRLAVFAGGWTLDAAEKICAGAEIATHDVFELLSHLIDKSLVLVVPQHAGRYRLLETIRQYALEKLAASGEANMIRQKHATYFYKLADADAPNAPNAPTKFDWLLRLQVEHDNLRAALAWSLANIENTGLDRRAAQAGEIWMSAWALNRLGWLAREEGDLETARARLESSLAVYREIDDALGIAWTEITLGEVLSTQGELDAATTILQDGLQRAREQNDAHAIGWALNHLGHVAQLYENFSSARELHAESLQVFQANEYFSGMSWAHQALGDTAVAEADAGGARREFRHVIQIAQTARDGTGLAWALNGLGCVAVLEENPKQAIWFWGASNALRQAFNARPAPAAHTTYEKLLQQARAQLDTREFETLWQAGQSASLDTAIEQANKFIA